MKNIILFGPPGSGKGTQAEYIKSKYHLLHISTGDLFRHNISNSTPLGVQAKTFMDKGQLVPDSVTIGMLVTHLEGQVPAGGFIFDGFPRNLNQAEALDSMLAVRNIPINALISLEVPEQEIVNRILKRGETSGRPDDKSREVIQNRIKIYKAETEPVKHHYRFKGICYEIDGMGSIDDVFYRICMVLDNIH